jgi:hypothetical protein
MESNPDTEIFNPLLYRLSFLGFNGCRMYEVSARPDNNRSPMTQGCIKEASMRRINWNASNLGAVSVRLA